MVFLHHAGNCSRSAICRLQVPSEKPTPRRGAQVLPQVRGSTMRWKLRLGPARSREWKAGDGPFFACILATSRELRAEFDGKENCSRPPGYYDLPNRVGVAWRGFAACFSLLLRAAPLLAAGTFVVIGGEKFRRRKPALDLYRSGRASDSRASPRRTWLHNQVLGAARHRKNRIKGRPNSRAFFETKVKRIEAGHVWVSNHADEYSVAGRFRFFCADGLTIRTSNFCAP